MKFKVWKKRFAIAKAKKQLAGAFASIDDGKELTSIMQENRLKKSEAIKAEKGYKLITFTSTLPFNLVGFISKVSAALAKEGIPIFVVSGYSRDHILIKEKYLKKAVNALNKLRI